MVLSVIPATLSPSRLQHHRVHHQHPHHNYSHNHNHRHHRTFSNLCGCLTRGIFNWTLTLTFLMSSLMLSRGPHIGGGWGGVWALSCAACDPTACPNTTDCPGGRVLDICSCCQVCARMENQSCGGLFGILGKCDGNLQCFIQPVDGGPITGNEEGVCKEVQEFFCNETDCPPAYEERLCPPDSYLATSNSRHKDNSNNNNNNANNDDNNFHDGSSEMDNLFLLPEQTSYCVCNTSLCEVPVCALGYSLHLVQNATGLPGTCCDVYECTKADDCQSVMCPPVQEVPCPGDSIRLPPVWTVDQCCEIQQGCTCPPADQCAPVWCPAGFQVQVISRASRWPGSCCDRFRCVNESGLTCTYNGKELRNGETWNIDKCKTCECRDGLNRCRDKSCRNLSCTWMVIPDGECCPVCRGCVSDSGELYNDSAVWMENDCTTCTCRDGYAQCQSEMCAVHCTHPKYIPGQCCPVCEDDEESMIASLCPSLESCDIKCKHGLEQSPIGCSLCRCKNEEEPCTLDCPNGLKSDVEGNPICQCQEAEHRCPPWDEEMCEKKCEYGYKRSRDGCIKCKCNKCPQFNCTKRCIHGHILNDEGCPLCKCQELPVPELIGSNEEPEDIEGRSCVSRHGSRHENGESWNDGCRVCYCHNGVEMCSLIACPAPHCSNPVFRVGDCCPTCPGLTVISPNGEKELCQSYLGHYYVEGETWKMDECTHCVCHGGTILCETPTCPPVLCHHPVRQEGQCCATCRGEDIGTSLLSGLHHHRCKSSTGMLYKHGEVWQSTPCQSCMCQDGQMHCYNQMCPPINCNRTVLRKGQCCPTCVETTKPKVCSYNGVTYDSGERWQGDNCTQCLCSGGQTECFPLSCPSLQCSVMIRKRGQCCPECYDLSHQPSQTYRSDDTDKGNSENETAPLESSSGVDGNIVGFAVLGLLVFLLAIAIFLLVLYILRRRRGLRFRPRPKSTNVELQGHMPFISDSQNKTVNMEKQYLEIEKLCPGIAGEKYKGDRASNDYTEMVFRDQGKETIGNGHFLSSMKS